MAMPEAPIQLVDITIPVRVEISPEERDRAGLAMAESVEVNKTLLSERTALVSDYTTRIKQNQGVMQREAGLYKRGFEEIETACQMEVDRAGKLCRISRETPEGVVWIQEDWKPLTAKQQTLADAALQPDLPGTGDPEAAAGDLDATE